MSPHSFRHSRRTLPAGTLIAAGLLLAGTNGPARAGPILDPIADFLPTYTGPQNPGLDVVAHEVLFVGDRLNFFGRMAGPIAPTQAIGGLYLIGLDRGQGTPRFLGGTPIIGPNVLWDLIVRINPDGTGLVNNQLAGVVTPLNPDDISINDNEFAASVPLSLLLPAATRPPLEWTYNLWPRNGIVIGQNVNVSDLAPDDGNSPVRPIPEPASMLLLSTAAIMVGLLLARRRRLWSTNLHTKTTWAIASALSAAALMTCVPRSARADIFQWEYINPPSPGLGKQRSTTLAPDGGGANVERGANLAHRNLTKAYLIGADLGAALPDDYPIYGSDLTGANLSQADLSQATLYGANLSNVSFTQATLVSTNFIYAVLSGANLSQANLMNAHLFGATLTGANLTDAEVRGATFWSITAAQLYSTASYQAHDLTGIRLDSISLAGVNLPGQNLTNASFIRAAMTGANLSQANLSNAYFVFAMLDNADLSEANLTNASLDGATLTGAKLTGAEVRGAGFSREFVYPSYFGGLTLPQLYSTASYHARDLTGIRLASNNLAGANLAGQNLTNANLIGATLTNADLSQANLTHASFTAENYWDVADLTGANLTGANLTNAFFGGSEACGESSCGSFPGANLTGANLSGADARGATFYLATLDGANTSNLIPSDGHIAGLDLSAGESLVVRDYDSFTGIDIPILVEQHLAMDATGTLRLVFDSDAWGSTISFAPGIPVALGGTLELTFAPDVDVATQSGRTIDLFDWTGVTPTGAFTVSSPYTWNLSKLYTTGEVTLAALHTIPGDFNGNGTVDAADYILWRKQGGTPQQYATWRANFGQPGGSGAAIPSVATLSSAVPEPATLALLVLGLPFLVCRNSRQSGTGGTSGARRFALAAATPAITFARSDQ